MIKQSNRLQQNMCFFVRFAFLPSFVPDLMISSQISPSASLHP
jgi:hypothetical protein